jgi:hypothetical protein
LVLLGCGGKGEKLRADGARIGKTEAGIETLVEACRIDRGENEAALLAAGQRERLAIGERR